MKKKYNLGFTLIELLVVIIIIGVMATLAIPSYQKIIQRSYLAEAEATLGSIKRLQESYRMEAGSYCPDIYKDGRFILNLVVPPRPERGFDYGVVLGDPDSGDFPDYGLDNSLHFTAVARRDLADYYYPWAAHIHETGGMAITPIAPRAPGEPFVEEPVSTHSHGDYTHTHKIPKPENIVP